jgi:glycosyltransferase involved in cell wall biosynthesis
MKKILFINGGILNNGGIERFILNYGSSLPSTDFNKTVLVFGKSIGILEHLFVEKKFKIHKLNRKSINIFRTVLDLFFFFSKEKFDIVYSNIDSMNGMINIIAFLTGVKKRISHSHNTNVLSSNPFVILIHYFFKIINLFSSNLFVACSLKAGRWLYGKKKFLLLNNAIDLGFFKPNVIDKTKIKNLLKIQDRFRIIGCVARFEYQKNHDLLIDIFNRILSINSNFLLILIGDGTTKKSTIDKINKLNISSNVLLFDSTILINNFYNIFDSFILTSRFEGLPFSAVEAQAYGIPVFLPSSISSEVKINKNVYFINYKDSSIEEIANYILLNESKFDFNYYSNIINNGYSLQENLLNFAKLLK